MKHILSATVALTLLSLAAIASAQYDDYRGQRDDRYSRDRNDRDRYDRDKYDRDRYDRDRYDRRDSAFEQERQRNVIWRDLFAQQEAERREFYLCTPYRKGSRDYNRALDRILDRQEQERSEMRDRMSRGSVSYRGR